MCLSIPVRCVCRRPPAGRDEAPRAEHRPGRHRRPLHSHGALPPQFLRGNAPPLNPPSPLLLQSRFPISERRLTHVHTLSSSARLLPSAQVSPSVEFHGTELTTRPRDVTVGAVTLVLVVAVFVLALDALTNRHLTAVVISAVRQHEAKAERMWSVMGSLAYSSTIASQVADPAWSVVGGLDVLRSTHDLLDLQQRVVVRTHPLPTPYPAPYPPYTTLLRLQHQVVVRRHAPAEAGWPSWVSSGADCGPSVRLSVRRTT